MLGPQNRVQIDIFVKFLSPGRDFLRLANARENLKQCNNEDFGVCWVCLKWGGTWLPSWDPLSNGC